MELSFKKWWWVPLCIVLFVALDQVSKVLVFHYVADGSSVVLIKNLFSIERVWNDGASFGMLSGQIWLFVVLTFVMLTVFTYVFYKYSLKKSKIFSLSYVFIIAGAVGNLIDRLTFFMVRDFIHINFFPAIFNLADIFVTVGTILLIVYILFVHKFKEKKEKAA